MSQQPPVHEAQLVLVSGHPEDFASGPLYQLITDPKDSRGVCLPTIVKHATLRETLFYLAMHGLRSWTSGTMSHDDLLGGEGTAGGAFLAELRRFAPRLIDVSISTELTKQLSDDDDRQQCNSVVFAINGVPKLLSCGVDSSQILAQWEHQVLEVVEEHSRLERRKEIRKYLAQLQPTQTWRDALTEDNASQQLLREVEDAAATELVEQAPPPSSPPASLLCHVRLENLIGNMTLPCVLDIKVGRVRFHPCTPRKKRDKITFEEVHRQESTVQQFGLRICGAQHYHADRESSEGAFVLNCVEKKFGHRDVKNRDDFKRCVQHFFSPLAPLPAAVESNDAARHDDGETEGTCNTRILCAAKALRRAARDAVASMLAALDAHSDAHVNDVALVSSSILFAYDATEWRTVLPPPGGLDDADVEDSNTVAFPNVKVSLIDFGRCGRRDLNFSEDVIQYRNAMSTLCDFLSAER